MTLWLAVEGPCCAGKTTLGQRLRATMPTGHVTIIPDYADFVGGKAGMPNPDPASWDQERLALDALLAVEEVRARQHIPGPPPPLVIIDRSILTLAGHCAGLDRRSPSRPAFAGQAEALLAADPRPRWPQAVVYLDVPHATQLERNRSGKFTADSVFMDAAYNAGFRAHFAAAAYAERLPTAWVDGTRPADAVAEQVRAFVVGLL